MIRLSAIQRPAPLLGRPATRLALTVSLLVASSAASAAAETPATRRSAPTSTSAAAQPPPPTPAKTSGGWRKAGQVTIPTQPAPHNSVVQPAVFQPFSSLRRPVLPTENPAPAEAPAPEAEAFQLPPNVPAPPPAAAPLSSGAAPAATTLPAVKLAPELPEDTPPPNAVVAPPLPDSDRVTVPLKGAANPIQIQISGKDDRISLTARDAPVDQVAALIAQQHGLNIVTGENVKGVISVTLNDVPLDSALDAVLKVNGYTWVRKGDIILITAIGTATTAVPSAQGREIRIFTLNYRAAADVDKIVKGLLSPVGRSIVIEASPQDKRRTREQVVVEDLPEYVERIAVSLAQTDVPPRQVLIEAYVLQVSLKDDTRHGVDIQNLLARVDNSRVTVKTVGFTDPDASPAFFLGIDGTDLDVLVEAIKTTSDAKTLASPKVLVVNGQEARIQVGAQLGYLVKTTTQTTTIQQVDFLELGVVLRVTPQITESGEILMHIKPEVSSGQINPSTGLPEEETTEVETTVMLPDGKGMIIGGLIKEADNEGQSKIPLVGDLWVVGRFFQRKQVHRERNEIVIALVPRLVDYDAGHPVAPVPDANDAQEWSQATTRLVGPQLQRVDRRPAEPELPDAVRNPRKLSLSRLPELFRSKTKPYPRSANYFFPAADERWVGGPRPLVYDSPAFGEPDAVFSAAGTAPAPSAVPPSPVPAPPPPAPPVYSRTPAAPQP